MTTDKSSRARRILRQLLLSTLLLGVGAAAFRLSFDAQVILAVASGVDAGLAGLYPLIIDLVIVLATLVVIWIEGASKAVIRYVWTALGFWTATSVLGNAVHVFALPEGRITLPIALAIGVNTMPALSLFLAIHLATTAVFRRVETPAAPARQASRTKRADASTRPTATPAADIPPADIDHIMGLYEELGSTQKVADAIGRSKSYTANQIANEKKRRADANAA